MASQALPEPMNSQPHHSKVKVSITLADPVFVAGTHVAGKLAMECRADKGLGVGIMMIELFAIQELSSRDHSATSTFLHSRRLFQGPSLPPSNAVQAHPIPGDPPLPQDYYQARRGHSTFLFRIPIPATSPSSINFGNGLAKVRYELRASVGVFWKNEKRLVVDKRPIDVVEAYPYEDAYMGQIPEAIVVGENGKLWMQGKIIGSIVVAGESACLELQVKNHSAKKNTGLTLTLTRTLYLPGSAAGQQRIAPVQIQDTLMTVPFRGPEYIIPPGAEGVANLVFDVPKHARGVRGGTLDGEESEAGNGARHTDSLFEIRCKVEVKLTMGMGSKVIVLEIPVEVVHPNALPPPQEVAGPFSQPYLPSEPMVSSPAYPDYNYFAAPPISPVPLHMPYLDPVHNQVWLPPPPPLPTHTPLGYPYLSHSPTPPDPYQSPLDSYGTPHAYYAVPQFVAPQQNLLPPPGAIPEHQGGYLPRPSSAGPVASASEVPPPIIPGLPIPSLLPLPQLNQVYQDSLSPAELEPTVGKGDRALRVTKHLRMTSRNRSVSPQSHRYPLPAPSTPTKVNENYMQDPSTPGASGEGVHLHSPRPQLTPKHSFTRDPVVGTSVKSERVDQLERMADAVARKSHDLSGDLPKGMADILSAAANKAQDEKKAIESAEANVNKTLPGPPVPSGKPLLAPPSRARADLYFAAENDDALAETAPLPSDQTPPTPALLAVLPSGQRTSYRNDLKQSESGLDALERRLLAEVGTRKMDTRHMNRDSRPDVRSVLPIDTFGSTPLSTSAIPIPQKSPEPLHDSAISSLTLAGGLAGGDDSDGDFDGRTHRAGRSGGGSSDGRGEVRGGLHMHMRERAQASTPPKMEKEKSSAGSERNKERSKEGKTSGKKRERGSTKSSAKGRVAAWLGGIDPDVPPQEQIIPPSPSVLQNPRSPFENDDDRPFVSQVPAVIDPWAAPTTEDEPKTETAAPPNPRSSGFVPIATLKRDSIRAPPLLLRDTTVSEDARRIQDIWSSGSPPAVHDKSFSKGPLTITPVAPPLTVRTDRRVSPPSAKAPMTMMTTIDPSQVHRPLSYSAAARSKPKTPEPTRAQPTTPLPPPLPAKTSPPPPGRGRVNAVFPPTRPVDTGVKYDIRSARGGRGGKVTAVANMWGAGANSNTNANSKPKPNEAPPRPKSIVPQHPPPPPAKSPPRAGERKLFSAAVMTPAPPSTPPRRQPGPSKTGVTAASPAAPGAGAAKPRPGVHDPQKRPDSRALFHGSNPSPRSSPRKAVSSNALSTHSSGPMSSGPGPTAAEQKRPATAMGMASGKLYGNGIGRHTPPVPTQPPGKAKAAVSEGSSAGKGPSGHGMGIGFGGAKGLLGKTKQVVKATTSDPAVVSSSHAIPTLSTTASLARPPNTTGNKSASAAAAGVQKPVAGVLRIGNGILGPALDTVLSAGAGAGPVERPVSPSKPVDMAFGQARLRDLIKKYQGQGQKT